MRDWETRIVEAFPWQFPNGAFGFAVGDGWADLLMEMCRRIDVVVADDWKTGACRLTDVKEKFGTLRVGFIGPDEVDRIIDWAEEVSAQTCDICGAGGRMRRGGWLSVRCDTHAE